LFQFRRVVTAVAAHARRQRQGQTFVEYGLLLTLIALVVLAVLALLGPIIDLFYSNTANALP